MARIRSLRPLTAGVAYVREGIGLDSVGSGGRWRSHAGVEVRYYIDPETELPDIYRHGVGEDEVEEVLRRPLEDRPGGEGSRSALGRTQAGRYLRVIYVPEPQRSAVFVITAYDLRGKPLAAYRRRRRQRHP